MNEHEEVLLFEDPESAFSDALLELLIEYALRPTFDESAPALDALEHLLSTWDEAGEAGLISWAASHHHRDLVVSRDSDGNLIEGEGVLVAEIPSGLIDHLIAEILQRSGDDRVRGIEALRELVSEWVSLICDDEKLVGHLVLSHRVPVSVAEIDSDGLLSTHAALHSRRR